jgi:hypothetical protein
MIPIATIPIRRTPVQPTVTITLTETELQALAGLLDAGVKATGLASVKGAAAVLAKLEAAAEAARAEAANDTEQKEAA